MLKTQKQSRSARKPRNTRTRSTFRPVTARECRKLRHQRRHRRLVPTNGKKVTQTSHCAVIHNTRNPPRTTAHRQIKARSPTWLRTERWEGRRDLLLRAGTSECEPERRGGNGKSQVLYGHFRSEGRPEGERVGNRSPLSSRLFLRHPSPSLSLSPPLILRRKKKQFLFFFFPEKKNNFSLPHVALCCNIPFVILRNKRKGCPFWILEICFVIFERKLEARERERVVLIARASGRRVAGKCSWELSELRYL